MSAIRSGSAIGCYILGIGFFCLLTPALAETMQIVETDDSLTVRHGEKIVLVYNKVSPPLPEGMDPVYRRSGFLHPVNSPKSKTVTDTFPQDHPHQHGIFSAWVKTSYGERPIDFWNLAGKTGRVVHERVVSTLQSDRSVSFEVDMIHRAEGSTPADVMRERWKVTVYQPIDNYYCFDIDSSQEALTETPLVIHQYHYGGMALRGNSRWLTKTDKDKAKDLQGKQIFEPGSFINNLGQDRIAGNHVPATWVALTGTIEQESVSIAVLGHPKNFRAPQPARLHGTKPYFCFSPCVNESFEISREKPLRAKYRYLVTDAPPDPEWIEARWLEWSEIPMQE